MQLIIQRNFTEDVRYFVKCKPRLYSEVLFATQVYTVECFLQPRHMQWSASCNPGI